MTFRTDVTIDWLVSPRIINVAAPSTTITIQDLYDTLRVLESHIYNLVFDSILSAGGKETLNPTTLNGVTLTLFNAQLKFEDRVVDTRATVTNGNLVSVDTNGDIIEATAFSTQVNVVTELSSSATISLVEVLQSSIDALQADITTILTALTAADLIVAAGSTSTVIRTNATQADNFYDGMLLVIENAAGVDARNIQSYSNTNGAFTVEAFPFTPATSDRAIIVNQAEVFDFIVANAALIPAAL